MTRRVKISDLDLDDLGTGVGVDIAGDTGMDIEVDTRGLSHSEIESLRETIYPNVIRSFRKHSQIMKALLDNVVRNVNDPRVGGGYVKCIYCRVKANVSSTGMGISETYSRELVASIDFKDEEREPDIAYRTMIKVSAKGETKELPLEVDANVISKLLNYMGEDEARTRVSELARKKVELDIEQFIPISGVTRIIMAEFPLPGSIRLGGRVNFGKLSERHPNTPVASITIQVCYEDENCQCSYCTDFTFGTEAA